MSTHPFNSKPSYWNYKDSKHFYSSKRVLQKMPATLSTNFLPLTLNKQMNFQSNKLINNSFKMFPRSRNYENPSLKNCSKNIDLSLKIQNTFPKKSVNKTSKLLQENVQTKKDSKKLMGEIMAITHQLKLKSKSLGSSCEQRLKQERCDSISKIRSIKVPSKTTPEKKVSLSHYSSSNNGKNLFLSSSSNNFQIPAACSTDRLKKIHAKNTADCFKKLINSRNSGNNTVYANMQKELNKIEKILENSSNRTTKNFSNHLTRKTNATYDVITNHSREANIKNSDRLVKTILKPIVERKKTMEQNSKFNAITNKNNLKNCQSYSYNCSSFSKGVNKLPKTPNKLKSKYKIVNKALATKKIVADKNATTNCVKSVKISRLKKKHLSSYKLINISTKNSPSNSKMSYNHLPVKNSRISVRSQYCNLGRQKQVSNYFIKKQNASRSHLPEHVSQKKLAEIHNASGVDSDLLIELAAENSINIKQISQRRLYKSKNRIINNNSINLKQISQRCLYKSKNRIINNHSIQERTAKMIKSKYFNPSRKYTDWRNLATHTSKGFYKGSIAQFNRQNKSFTRINKSMRSNKIVSNKFQTRKVRLQNKKIVTLKGEKFIVGSEGKSLKKLKQISKCKKKTKRATSYNKYLSEVVFPEKVARPTSKIMANRVLSLSINRMLSASEKKKMNKVNIYCMFYNRFGRCNKGVQCPYVHDPSKIAVCTRFLRGTCKNNKCPFSHEINPGKMAICSFFLQDICTNSQCPYRHEKLSPDAKLCKDFVQGYCLKGKECKKAHVLVCPKYIQGICEKGKDCVFPHPVARDKKSISKECINTLKNEDHLSETVSRYFQSNHDKNAVRGLVVPRRKTLPEQPSFISLTMEESS